MQLYTQMYFVRTDSIAIKFNNDLFDSIIQQNEHLQSSVFYTYIAEWNKEYRRDGIMEIHSTSLLKYEICSQKQNIHVKFNAL